MKKIDLTFCICAYNAEKYIVETLESLLNQTFRDFYLWIIDDCSTDNTKQISEEFFEKHDWQNTKIISLEKNGGLANARRFAENIVETKYIGFIDADDIADSLLVEKLYKTIISDDNCMTVSCFCKYISPESKKIGGGIFIGPTSKEEFTQQSQNEKLMFIPPVNISQIAFIRKAGCRVITGFPEGRPRYQDMCEDLDLWTRMSDFWVDEKYIVVIPEPLLKYRKIPTSVSANASAMSWRIRHIKNNLKRRRRGLIDLTFCEYRDQVSKKERMIFAYKDWATNLYKQAGFHYMQKHYFRFGIYLLSSALFYPQYFIQKIKKNILPSLRIKK